MDGQEEQGAGGILEEDGGQQTVLREAQTPQMSEYAHAEDISCRAFFFGCGFFWLFFLVFFGFFLAFVFFWRRVEGSVSKPRRDAPKAHSRVCTRLANGVDRFSLGGGDRKKQKHELNRNKI